MIQEKIDRLVFKPVPFTVNDDVKSLIHNLKGDVMIYDTLDLYVLQFHFGFPKNAKSAKALTEFLEKLTQ